MDKQTESQVEAAVLRRLLAHLAKRSDVQNIDLMNLVGFCRNCLSRWCAEEAAALDVSLDKSAAREAIYGMPYDVWKAQYQTEATTAQQDAFVQKQPKD